MKFMIALFATLAVANAQIIMSGTCQNVSLQKDFDVPRYTGKWNELYRYEQIFQVDGDCVTANYTLLSNGTVTVLNQMVVGPTRFQISGSVAVAPDANGEGKLIVSFPTTDNSYSDYWVLSTDYDNYSLVYSCKDLANNNKRVSSWILSRTPMLSPQTVLALTPIIEATPGLNWDSYRQTSFSTASCNFTNTVDV
ncbi:apolipoprotein D-like [Arctopsyche grandis]|uniref:apolipoprotein D-like n=1 Tax=Arctopsyche grandis TaxID=121162 RepID=UPI00406D8084